MKIKRLYINNYKSLVDFELVEPNPFSVFVGPNAAGKSNVFEALEFLSFSNDFIRGSEIFEGAENFLNKQLLFNARRNGKKFINVEIKLEAEIPNTSNDVELIANISYSKEGQKITPAGGNTRSFWGSLEGHRKKVEEKENAYIEIFSRIFIKLAKVKSPFRSSNKLSSDAANLEPVLHRILQDEAKQEEIADWLQILIPGLDRVEVAKSDLSGDYFLRIFEKHLDEPIGKNLISNGTYNILALLTAVYQSDEPQFLCIEEPENGLNPYVIRTLVGFFRQMCEEKGHYIWLNTHSATLVRELKNEEIILIDKKEGITRAKQIPADFNRYDLEMDEAWLTNALGGGLPW